MARKTLESQPISLDDGAPASERSGVVAQGTVWKRIATIGPPLVRRFVWLTTEDRETVLRSAWLAVQHQKQGVEWEPGPALDAAVTCQILRLARGLDHRRWAESLPCLTPSAALSGELTLGRLRVDESLRGTLHQVAWLLDAVSFEKEEPRIVIYTGIAYGKNREAVYKTLSRAWQSFSGGEGAETDLAKWDMRWREVSRHLFELSPARVQAARAYIDACEANPALVDAIEALSTLYFERKQRTERATEAWVAFRADLDRSRVRPADVADLLRAHCTGLGVDDRVPRKSGPSRETTWRALLHGVTRPAQECLDSWSLFLASCGFEGFVLEAWQRLVHDTRAARKAREAIKPTYREILRMAKAIPAWCDARDNLLGLVERSTEGDNDEAAQH